MPSLTLRLNHRSCKRCHDSGLGLVSIPGGTGTLNRMNLIIGENETFLLPLDCMAWYSHLCQEPLGSLRFFVEPCLFLAEDNLV